MVWTRPSKSEILPYGRAAHRLCNGGPCADYSHLRCAIGHESSDKADDAQLRAIVRRIIRIAYGSFLPLCYSMEAYVF